MPPTASVTYVYNVWGQDKAVASKKARASKKTASTMKTAVTKPTATASTSKPTTSNGARPSSVEDLLKAAAAELGLGRALEILHAGRARVRRCWGERPVGDVASSRRRVWPHLVANWILWIPLVPECAPRVLSCHDCRKEFGGDVTVLPLPGNSVPVRRLTASPAVDDE